MTTISANSITSGGSYGMTISASKISLRPSTYTMGNISFRQGEDPAFISITGSPERPLGAYMDGPLPNLGERVELVCVTRTDNEMGFALRVIPDSYK